MSFQAVTKTATACPICCSTLHCLLPEPANSVSSLTWSSQDHAEPRGRVQRSRSSGVLCAQQHRVTASQWTAQRRSCSCNHAACSVNLHTFAYSRLFTGLEVGQCGPYWHFIGRFKIILAHASFTEKYHTSMSHANTGHNAYLTYLNSSPIALSPERDFQHSMHQKQFVGRPASVGSAKGTYTVSQTLYSWIFGHLNTEKEYRKNRERDKVSYRHS